MSNIKNIRIFKNRVIELQQSVDGPGFYCMTVDGRRVTSADAYIGRKAAFCAAIGFIISQWYDSRSA